MQELVQPGPSGRPGDLLPRTVATNLQLDLTVCYSLCNKDHGTDEKGVREDVDAY
jgi:hypothetical protein